MNAVKILNTCNARGTKESFSIRGITGDHIMWVDLKLDKSIFQNSFCKDDSVIFGLKMDTFCKCLSMINHDYVDIFLNDADVLSLSSQDICYSIKLLDIEENELTDSKINSKNCHIGLDIDYKLLTDSVHSISKLGENIQFKFLLENNDRILQLYGSDIIGSGYVNMRDKEGSGLQFNKFHESIFTYNIKCIENIFKHNFSNSINLLFTEQGVLKCRHEIHPSSYLDFLLAPQIEED